MTAQEREEAAPTTGAAPSASPGQEAPGAEHSAPDYVAAKVEAALAYAARGWPPVPLCTDPCDWPSHNRDGPCSTPGKRPIINWRTLGLADEKTIRGWYERHPWAGLGILTGDPGPVVIDEDEPGALDHLAADIGEEIPATYVVRTPGSTRKGRGPGRHVYLEDPGEYIANNAGQLGDHLDVRSKGGLVVAPPTIRPEGPYELERDNSLGKPGPQLVDRLRSSGGKKRTRRKLKRPDDGAGRSSLRLITPDDLPREYTLEEAQAHVQPYLDRLEQAAPGSRNATLNEAATVLSHFVTDGFWTEDEAVEILLETAHECGLVDDDGEAAVLATIESGLSPADDWKAARKPEPEPRRSRRVDLVPFLEGTYEPPEPTVGATRSDGVRLLYAGKWHTVIGLTGAGKSWLAAWEAAAELAAGNVVVYLHFEEADPGSTVARFRALDVPDDAVRDRLIWLDTADPWTREAFEEELAALDPAPTLVILDGINAACGLHGWNPLDTEGVNAYRLMFEKPATRLGAAVLSLGHPVKDRTRQGERHSFGSGDWLNLVDGVGLRLEAVAKAPIHRGARGSARLYSVKDRHGGVERHGTLNGSREAGWYFLGMFTVDDSPMAVLGQDRRPVVTAELAAPVDDEKDQATATEDKVDELADAIVRHLEQNGRRYESKNRLADQLRATRLKFSTDDLGPALERLEQDGRLEMPPYERSRPRPGWLTDPEPATADTDPNPFEEEEA